jgi:hypothetical protein
VRGVFLIKGSLGYDVCVDDHDLKMDVSWTEANKLATRIAAGRAPGDGRGYGRCRHEGNKACFAAMECLRGPVRNDSEPRPQATNFFDAGGKP